MDMFDFASMEEEEGIIGFRRDGSIKRVKEEYNEHGDTTYSHQSDHLNIMGRAETNEWKNNDELHYHSDEDSSSSSESSGGSDKDTDRNEKPDNDEEQFAESGKSASGKYSSGKYSETGWDPRSERNRKPHKHYHRPFRSRRGSSISNVATSAGKKYVATASDVHRKLRSKRIENGMDTLVQFETDGGYDTSSNNGIWDFFNIILCGVPTVMECPAEDPGLNPPLKSIEDILRS